MPEPVQYYGKYRGNVASNEDPLKMGRITAIVPDVLGQTASGWAMPALPLAGPQVATYAIPPVGAGVWVEFEHGDKSFPIWTGCWWGSEQEVPPSAQVATSTIPPNIVLQPQAGPQGAPTVILTGNEAGSGDLKITLTTPGGASVIITNSEVLISNGQGASISLIGKTVNINDGALTIT
jgi:uncharacterized protein involved in type VI secretion and phage assembly